MAPISIRDVKKSYGKTPVVHGVDLEIQSGEFIVILGPSGCGKSTLLRMPPRNASARRRNWQTSSSF